MVGGICVVDSHNSTCLCVVALASTRIDQTNNGDLSLRKKSVGKKLSSSFMGRRFRAEATAYKKPEKVKGFVIVNNLGGQYDDEGFGDVKAQIFNLFTLIAVSTVMNELYETNPTQHRWFNDFVRSNKPSNGKRFLHILQKENHKLAETVMVTRLRLFAKWIKDLDHTKMYKDFSDQNLELMRERLLETVKWPCDDTDSSSEIVG